MNAIKYVVIENTGYKEIPLVFRYHNGEARALPLKVGQKTLLTLVGAGDGFQYTHDRNTVDFADLNAGGRSDDLMFYRDGKIGYYERATAFGYNHIANVSKSNERPTTFIDNDGINKGGRAHFSTRYDNDKLVISIHGDDPVYDGIGSHKAVPAYHEEGAYL